MSKKNFEVKLIEHACDERLYRLLNSRYIPIEDKNSLKKYKRLRSAKDTYIVKYKYSPSSIDRSGRLMRETSQMERNIRYYLLYCWYHDIDITNCQPNLCLQLMKRFDIICEELTSYCEDREKFLLTYGVDKQHICSVLFYEKFHGAAFFEKINKAVYEKLVCKLKENHGDIWNISQNSKQFNKTGSFVALVLQTYENQVLQAMFRFFTENGFNVGNLIYDGLHVMKVDNQEKLPMEILRKCEEYIFNTTGFILGLQEKPMIPDDDFLSNVDVEIEFEEVEENECFDAEKAIELYDVGIDTFIFYMNHFFAKVTHEGTIWFIFRDTIKHQYLLRTEKITIAAYKEYKVLFEKRKMSIIDVWSSCHGMKKFKHIIFDPSYIGSISDENLNLYTGLKAKIVTDINHEKVESILKHIRRLNNGDERATEYVVNWLALMFQNPGEKNGTALVFNGNQGTGKNLFADNLIGKNIIGKNGHYAYAGSSHELLGNFNDRMCNKILIVGDELTFGGNHQENNLLKSKITQGTSVCEKKGVDSFTVDDFTNYIFFSNNDWVVKIEKTDRRYFVQRSLNILTEEESKEFLEVIDTEGSNSFYTYLMQLDLSNFNVRKIPMTEEKKRMMSHSMSALDLYVFQLLSGEIRCADDEWVNLVLADDDKNVCPEQYYTKGHKYETTIDELWRKFRKFIDDSNVTDRMNKNTFGQMIRTRLMITNKSTNRNGGTPIWLTVQEP